MYGTSGFDELELNDFTASVEPPYVCDVYAYPLYGWYTALA